MNPINSISELFSKKNNENINVTTKCKMVNLT